VNPTGAEQNANEAVLIGIAQAMTGPDLATEIASIIRVERTAAQARWHPNKRNIEGREKFAGMDVTIADVLKKIPLHLRP
jgi:hypothetical protein